MEIIGEKKEKGTEGILKQRVKTTDPESHRTPSKINTLPHTQKRQTKANKLYTLAFYFMLQKMKDKEILKRALVCEEPYVYRGINNFI